MPRCEPGAPGQVGRNNRPSPADRSTGISRVIGTEGINEGDPMVANGADLPPDGNPRSENGVGS